MDQQIETVSTDVDPASHHALNIQGAVEKILALWKAHNPDRRIVQSHPLPFDPKANKVSVVVVSDSVEARSAPDCRS